MDSDTDLVRRTAAGDREAWAELARRHLEAVHAFAWSLLLEPHAAEDAVQETFLRARTKAGSFEDRSAVRTWLCGIARMVCLEDGRRRSKPMPPVDRVSRQPTPAVALAEAERLEIARSRFARLAPEDRELLILAGSQGMSPAGIAGVLGCSAGAARVRLFRARERWRALARDLGGPP